MDAGWLTLPWRSARTHDLVPSYLFFFDSLFLSFGSWNWSETQLFLSVNWSDPWWWRSLHELSSALLRLHFRKERKEEREREREKKNEQRKRKNRSKENEKNNKGKGNNEQENDRSKGVQRSWFAKRTLFCNGLQPSNSLPLSEKEHRVFFASLWESLSEFLRISLSLSQDGREWRRHKGPSPDGHVTRRKREETSINLILVARPGAPSSEHCS